MSQLTHLDDKGQARMVDVGGKTETARSATATGRIRMSPEALTAIREGSGPKGDVLAAARIAGIMAAKRTGELIPLCHPLPLDDCQVKIHPDTTRSEIAIHCRVQTHAKTGVEMEALTAVAVAALTLYDMVKAVDKTMVIGDIELVEKKGGRSGHYRK